MSHDRSHDPATSETSQPADNISSSTLQLVDSSPLIPAQTWEGDLFDTEFLQQHEPWSAYAVDPLAPISAYNRISETSINRSDGFLTQRDSGSVAEPADTSGYASLQRSKHPEQYQDRYPDTMGELAYLGINREKEGFTSRAMQHSYREDSALLQLSERWQMSNCSPSSGVDATFARMREDTCVQGETVPVGDPGSVAFQFRLDRLEEPFEYRIEEPIPSGASTWSLASPTLPEVQPSSLSLPKVQEVLRCEYCEASFIGQYRRGNLGRHRRLLHTPAQYPCGEPGCTRTFRRSDARLKHYRKHHPRMAEGPAIPRRLFGHSWGDDRKDNVEQFHSPRGAERIPSATTPISQSPDNVFCSGAASSPAITMQSTIWPETSHEMGNSVQCDICQKTFGRAAELRRHNMSFHDSKTPEFYCDVPGCSRGIEPFARKDKLRDHMDKMHAPPTTTEASEAGEEDMQIIYSCPEDGCDKTFDHKAGLLRHQRTHTAKSERKHKCSQCDESFLYPKDLKRHEATHLNDGDKNKPSFYCEVASCEYGPGSQGFSRKDALLRHIKKLHPD